MRLTAIPSLFLALLLALWCGAPPAQAAEPGPPPPWRHVNGYLLAGPFLAFYEAQGGVDAFGEPRSDAFVDADGLTVQYFDTARLEWRGDHAELTPLGRWAAADHPDHVAFAWRPADAPVAEGRTYLPQAGHTVGGALGWHWQTHGGVALLGYPLSEEIAAPQPDGSRHLVQYFERVVLRYVPARDTAPEEVRREPLGARFAPERPRTEAPQLLAAARLPLRAGTPAARNIAAAAGWLTGAVVAPGERLSFLGAVGPLSEERGYAAGPAIVGGEVVTTELGGGVCTLATLLYRAAWAAGLPILERQAHRYWLSAYADTPGLEAAVATPGPDLVVRNDTGAPLIVEAQVEPEGVQVRLWGWSDGRRVDLAPPQVRAVDSDTKDTSGGGAPEGAALSGADPRRDGAEVVNVRVVRAQGGGTRRDQVVTRYTGMEAHPAPAPTDALTRPAMPAGPR